MTDTQPNEETIGKAKALVQALEGNDMAGASQYLQELSEAHDFTFFEKVGKLTRNLHTSINNVHVDNQLVDFTENGIADTKQRLEYVVTTTEEAANKSIDSIEKCLDKISKFEKDFVSNMDDKVGKEVQGFATFLHDELSILLTNQSYQDLTGQVIKKVITLVQEVESSLVGLIKESGFKDKAQKSAQADGVEAEGPQIDPKKQGVVSGQDEVDDLLSSLGF